MHSRAYLLLERDYEDLQQTPLHGISVRPEEDSFLKWIAKVRGLKDSLWEGAVLQVSLSYTEEYNYVPPTVLFNTIPFHPNVDPKTGRPCVDFLDKPSDWNPRYTMSYVLLAIQTLLSNPVMEDVVNSEAADALLNRPEEYRQMVLNCVKISRQIDAGSVQDYTPLRKKTSAIESTAAQRKIKAISFEEYHKIWSEIATSMDTQDLKPSRHKRPESGTQYKQTNEISTANKQYIIIHGLIGRKTGAIPSLQLGSAEDPHSCVFCRLSENCGIDFLGHSEPHTSQTSDLHRDAAVWFCGPGPDGEPQEEEVDHLVAWTNTLSSELLED